MGNDKVPSFSTVNPADNSIINEYQYYPQDHALAIAEKAHSQGFKKWRSYSYEKRASLFHALAKQLNDNVDKFARLITDEMGKTIRESTAEVKKCASLAEVLVERGEEWLQEELIEADGKRHVVCFEPLGSIYLIMPWNYPFWQPFKVALLPMFAGNSILLKHASNVTGSALAIEKIFLEAGFPEDVFRSVVVQHETSDKIIGSPFVQGVSLTGSGKAGASIAALAGQHLKKSVLELGGSDPFIVLRDADLKKAAKGAVAGRMNNCGQVCIGAKRIIVHEQVYDAFLECFINEVRSLKQGDPRNEDTDIGPLVNESAVQDMESFVSDAKKLGADILVGGERYSNDGAYFQPTVVSNPAPACRMLKEEVFGPVVPVIKVESDEQAITLANDTEFGLNASIWTEDLAKAEFMARQIEAGGVFVNHISASHPLLPLGGIKHSGYGRELSHIGIKEFVNVKPINIY